MVRRCPPLPPIGRVAAPSEDALLHEQQQRRGQQQRDGEGRRHLDLGREVKERPDLRGDRVKPGRQREDGRRAEQRQRLQHGQDEAAHQRRQHHRQRDRERHGEPAGAQDGGRLLQVGRDERQRVGDHDVDVGKRVDRDHEDQPRHAEDVQQRVLRAGRPAPQLVEQPRVGAGQHHPGEGAEERRRDEGGQHQRADHAPPRHVGAGGEPGQRSADGDRAQPHPERQHDRVPDGLAQGEVTEDSAIVSERGALLAAHAERDQPAQGQRHEHDQRERRSDPDDRRAVERPRAEPHAPKNSTKRWRISSPRFSSSSGSTVSSFRSLSLGLSVGYFTSGCPV